MAVSENIYLVGGPPNIAAAAPGDLAQRDPTVPALREVMEREVSLQRIGACGIMARSWPMPLPCRATARRSRSSSAPPP